MFKQTRKQINNCKTNAQTNAQTNKQSQNKCSNKRAGANKYKTIAKQMFKQTRRCKQTSWPAKSALYRRPFENIQGIVRNPFRYGEDGYPVPVIERRGKFIEFACDPQSRLSQVVAARGVEIIRVDKTTYDILDPESMRELDAIVDQGDCDMWGALPCLPWSTWQYVNMAKHGEAYRDKLGGEREISRRMVDECIRRSSMKAGEWHSNGRASAQDGGRRGCGNTPLRETCGWLTSTGAWWG